MNINKKKAPPSISKQKKVKETLTEAQPFSIPIEIKGKDVIIKLPKHVLEYLKLNKDSEINVIPVNHTLQLTSDNILSLIPALDLNQLEDEFVAQTV